MRKSTKKIISVIDDRSSNMQQTKLDKYFSICSDSQRINFTQTESRQNQFRNKIAQLQRKLNKAIELKDTAENKYGILYSENKKSKVKSREKITALLTEKAEMWREEKRKVNMNLGYFSNEKAYVEGEDIKILREKLNEKKERLEVLKSEQKKTKKIQQKARLKSAGNYVSNEIAQLQIQIKEKEKQIASYKERLRLAQKQKSCHYAREGWPTINDRYLPLELLGKGGFGEVYKCYDLEFHEFVAIKIINIGLNLDIDQSENILKHVKRQVNIQRSLKHPNIVEIKDLLDLTAEKIVFVLEYCEGPQLSVYLRKYKCLEEKEAKIIIFQIFNALQYMSNLTKKIIHYDLKPSNIIFHKGVIKILDFGLCKQMDGEESKIQLTSAGVGTYWYLPPQTFSSEIVDISEKVDVWSVGVIFFQLLYGQRPFGHGMSQQKILSKNLIVTEGKNLVFPEKNVKNYKVSEKARKFIEKCLAYYPEDRLSPQEAVNHDYFKL